jgi:hypothetical protein
MKIALRSTIAVAFLAIVALQSPPALAQQRVFVAAQGSDGNPCTFALPCRTFQHAHDIMAFGGEIDVLDPAGYGSLTITKPISIQGHGFSGISAASGNNGITINAGATQSVTLNGLLIEGGGLGFVGIQFNSGKSLVVENCVVRNFGEGLDFFSNGASLQTLSVSSSFFTDNVNDAIFIQPNSNGPITAAIERTAFYNNRFAVSAFGLNGTGTLDVAVTDSVAGNHIAGNPNDATFSVAAFGGNAISSLMLTRVTVFGNNIGVLAAGINATMRLAQSTITGNSAGGYQIENSATMLSYGDNYIDHNGPNIGTLGSASKQ